MAIAESIEKNNAGKPYDRLLLATSLNYSPNSSGFRQLIISSGRYGLTKGGYMADEISLTPLGSSIVAPTEEGMTKRGLREALTKPELFKTVFEFYDKKKIPPEELLKNSLRKQFSVVAEDVDVCLDVLMANIADFGLAQPTKGGDYLHLDMLATRVPAPTELVPEGEGEEIEAEKGFPEAEEEEAVPPPKPKQIFVAHGKNKKPLGQLKTILAQFKVPFKVAIEEPHKGRPIGEKVAELMRECTSGIFIFTADEETVDSQGNSVLKPSDNVVFELGAGIVLYRDKIVILREEGVLFGSDFTAYGHITFERDKLDAKAFELMKELIGLGFLQVKPT